MGVADSRRRQTQLPQQLWVLYARDGAVVVSDFPAGVGPGLRLVRLMPRVTTCGDSQVLESGAAALGFTLFFGIGARGATASPGLDSE